MQSEICTSGDFDAGLSVFETLLLRASAAVVVCPERCFRGEARAAVGSPQKIAAQPLSNTAVSGASRMV